MDSDDHVSTKSIRGADIATKLARFQAERQEEAELQFTFVLRSAVRIFGFGAVGCALSIVISKALSEEGGEVLWCLSILFSSSGAILLSSVPVQRLDLDADIRGRPGMGIAIALSFSCAAAAMALYPPHVHAAFVPFGLLTMLGCLAPKRCGGTWSQITFMGSTFAAVMCLGDGALRLADVSLPFHLRVAWSAMDMLATGIIFVLLVKCMRDESDGRWSKMVFHSAQIYFTATGATDIFDGLIPLSEGPLDAFAGAIEITGGMCRLGPVFLIFSIGQDRLFALAQRQFDSGRATRDGAVMAALLESSGVRVGGSWWIHRKDNEEDMMFSERSHRRRWRRGQVKSIEGQSFEVDMGHGEVVTVAMPSCIIDPSELVDRTRRELRCMEWRMMSQDIMTGKICGAAAGAFSNNELYQLSRELRTKELIEFFLTHSWHDDAENKWRKLAAFAEQFHERKGHDLTLWLDKTCIDQTRIKDGLLVLPVIVMSCRRLLCLWGPSYPTRLWCVWELFTLLAFGDATAAVQRICMIPLENNNDFALDLQSFDVCGATCYDPNEEGRLMEVIGALGSKRFNTRIRLLGKALATDSQQGFQRFTRQVSSRVVKSSRGLSNKSLSSLSWQLPKLESRNSSPTSSCIDASPESSKQPQTLTALVAPVPSAAPEIPASSPSIEAGNEFIWIAF